MFSCKVFLDLAKVVLEAHLLVLEQREGLLEVHNLQLCLVLHGLGLQRGVLSIIDLTVESGSLLPRLPDVLLQSGIVALYSR